jgi:ABC-type anion transport system duplicated permease subunit
MAFTLRKGTADTEAIALPISSITVSIGDMLYLGIGATTWSLGTSATTHFAKKAVAIEAATTAATEVNAILVSADQVWEATSNADAAAADNGDRMVLTDTATVNNTHTDATTEYVCFLQKGYAGATTDKKLVGWILTGNGVDPDATT